ncbi:MAG: aminotransferase class I/II-fold pyridoxal phosphate-dependent enzyme [Verrucomicrobia bacterium]|nr:aminotransferase class I/II-fold pyridoxal phosphate-dependent enzyme [Verrucomicrobiota bacterium]
MARIYLSPPDLSEADHKAVAAALASNWVAPVGPELASFEASVCEMTGRQAGLALNSGTAALHLALRELGIGKGDIVLCPSFTFAASANPILYCGATPVFLGSEARTWNLDPEALKEALEVLSASGQKPKAVIVVQLYGQCAEMPAIEKLCADHEVALIEDAAEALGASCDGRPAGSFGDFSFFSFNGNKIITSSGGGMLLSNDVAKLEHARKLSMQAREPVTHYEHCELGYNYRMSNVLAALGRSQLADLERRISVRKGHYAAYESALGDLPGLAFMPVVDAEAANFWLTCITIDPLKSGTDSASVIKHLEESNIEARPLWKPLRLQPVFEGIQYFGNHIEEDLFSKGLCLPSGSSLTDNERETIIKLVRSCYNKS